MTITIIYEIGTAMTNRPLTSQLFPACLILILSGGLLSGCSKSDPLIVSPAEINLNKVEAGSIIQRTITVTNPTDEPVTGITVKTSCSCTLASNPPTRLAPKESKSFEIQYDVPPNPGDVFQVISIEVGESFFQVPLVGRAVESIGLTPKGINLAFDYNVKDLLQSFKIELYEEPFEEIVRSEIQFPMKSEFNDQLQAGTSISIVADASKTTIYGMLTAVQPVWKPFLPTRAELQVTLQLKDGARRTVVIPVTASQAPDYYYSPKLISVVRSEDVNTRFAEVKLRFSRPIEVEEVRYQNFNQEARFTKQETFMETGDYKEVDLSIDISPYFEHDSTHISPIQILLSNGEQIVIPVYTIQA